MSAPYKIIDPDIVQNSECVKPADSQAIQEDDHRELIFHVKPNDSFAFLKLPDDDVTWYNIPLGNVVPRKSNNISKHENILIPVVPRCYTTVHPDEDFTEVPESPGFIYVFKDGFLWRELGVTTHGRFRDVNLARYQGKDWRPISAGGDNRILVPYKVDGQETIIEMCYSSFQWSWDYINRMGGMNKTDFRLDKNNPAPLASDLGVSEADAKKYREARMQVIPLNKYPSGFKKTTPQGNIASITNTSSTSHNYHMRIHRDSKVATVSLQDPIGIARRLHADLAIAIADLDALVLDARGLIDSKGNVIENPEAIANSDDAKKYRDKASRFHMAAFIANYLYTSVDDIKNSKRWKKLTEKQQEAIDDRKGWRGHLNEKDFKKFLNLEKIRIAIDNIQDKKALLIYYMESELKDNPYNTNAKFKDAMKDYFSCGKRGWLMGMETLNELLQYITQSPAGMATRLFTDIKEIDFHEEEDMGEDFVLQLHGAHPNKKSVLAKYQFPKCKKGTEDDPFPYEKNKTDPGLPEFNTMSFNKWAEEDSRGDNQALMQAGRRFSQYLNEILNNRALKLTGFAFKAKRRRKEAVSEKLQERVNSLNKRKTRTESKISKLEGELKNASQKLETATNNRENLERALSDLEEKKSNEKQKHKSNLNSLEENYRQGVKIIKEQKKQAAAQHKEAKSAYRQAAAKLRAVREEIIAIKRRIKDLNDLKSGKKKRFVDVPGQHMQPIATLAAMGIKADLEKAGLRLKNIITSLQDVSEGKMPDGTARINGHILADHYKVVISKLEELLDKNTRTLIALNEEGAAVGRVRMDSALDMRDSITEIMRLLKQSNSATGFWASEKAANDAARNMLVLEELEARSERDMAKTEEKNRHSEQKKQTHEEIDSTKRERNKEKATQGREQRKVDHRVDRVSSETETRGFIKRKIQQYSGFINNSKLWNEKYATRLNYGFNGLVGVFEIMNLWQAWDAYSKNNDSKSTIEMASAIVDLTATILTIQETIYKSRYGNLSQAQTKLLESQIKTAKSATGITPQQFSRYKAVSFLARTFNVTASFGTSLISANDAFIATQMGDDSAAVGLGFISIGALGMGAGLFAGGAAALALTGVGIALIAIGAIIYWVTRKEPMEKWLLNGPWGEDRDDRFGSGKKMHGVWPLDKKNPYYHWKQDIQYTYLALMDLVASPVASFKRKMKVLKGPVNVYIAELTVYAPNLAGADRFERILEFRPVGKKDYQRIDMSAKKERSSIPGVNLDEIWKDVEWQPLKDRQGYKLIFEFRKNFSLLLAAYGQIEIRARIRAWPNGKNEKLFPGSTVLYSLPNPERKLDGTRKVESKDYFSTQLFCKRSDTRYRNRDGSVIFDRYAEKILSEKT